MSCNRHLLSGKLSGEHQPTMLVRTKAKFEDTARAFGWSDKFEVCKEADMSKCDWKRGGRDDYTHKHFDTEAAFGNNCGRWFTSYSSVVGCYFEHNKASGFSSADRGKRCFSKGMGCEVTRDHVTMYKWSGTPPKPTTPKPTTPKPTTPAKAGEVCPAPH